MMSIGACANLRRLLRPAMLACAALVTAAAFAAEPAKFAIIEWVQGSVEILNANGQARPARVSEGVLAGETVVTGKDGELHVRTEDAGFVAFRTNTQVRIDSYLAKGGKDDNMALSLVKGALRSITGWLGRQNSANYSVRTATATVGIRGTDHETHYVPPPGPNDPPSTTPPGTYDKVVTGATVIQNMGGQVMIAAGQTGHAPHDARSAPRLLDRAPAIYRPGSNDARIETRKKELAREVEARIQERVNDIKDALKDLRDDKDERDLKDLKELKDAKDRVDPEAVRKAIERKRRKAAEK